MMFQRYGRLIIIGILSVVDIAEDQIPEGRCCFGLHAGENVGVDLHREGHTGMAEPFGNDFGLHAGS